MDGTVDKATAQQPKETSAAYSAFLDYLFMLPAERSIRVLLERYVQREREGASVPTTRRASLFSWSQRHRWQERIALYDDDQRRKRLQQEQEARAAMNKRHIQISQAIQGKILQWLKETNNKLEKPQDVFTALKVATDLERKAMGLPDSIMQLMNLSDDELLARYSVLLNNISSIEDSTGSELLLEESDE